MKKLAGLILAKQNSTRLPHKNVKNFHGKPMFLVNVEKCLALFDEVYVSSDSEEILKMAVDAGAIGIMRDDSLCGDTPNIPVYQHALKHMGDVDGIIAVQANSPTVSPKTIFLAKGLMEAGLEEVMTCHPMEHLKDYHAQNCKVYGSVWGLSREKLEGNIDPYRPNPVAMLIDESIDIETVEEYEEAILQDKQLL